MIHHNHLLTRALHLVPIGSTHPGTHQMGTHGHQMEGPATYVACGMDPHGQPNIWDLPPPPQTQSVFVPCLLRSPFFPTPYEQVSTCWFKFDYKEHFIPLACMVKWTIDQ